MLKDLINDEYFESELLIFRPPEEAYRYFPKDNELVVSHATNQLKKFRKIFDCNVPLMPFEEHRIMLLEKKIIYNYGALNKFFPNHWPPSETLRFLQSTEYNVDLTYKHLESQVKWYRSEYPFLLTKMTLEIMGLGILYIYGRDSRFRPIVVFRPHLFYRNRNNYSVEDFKRAIGYFFQTIINYYLLPGQIETWTVLIDIKDFKIYHITSGFKEISKYLSDHFRCRMYKVFILNAGFFVKIAWNITKLMCDEQVQAKICILKDKDISEVLRNINPYQLEQQYGGYGVNIGDMDKVFPPKPVSKYYLLEKDSPDELFVSEEKYKAIVEENKMYWRSPYIFEEKKKKKDMEYTNIKSIGMIVENNADYKEKDKISSLRSIRSDKWISKRFISTIEIPISEYVEFENYYVINTSKFRERKYSLLGDFDMLEDLPSEVSRDEIRQIKTLGLLLI